FEGRVRIDGSFRGQIRGEDVLVIGEGAKVIGEIEVATCIVTGGEVEANIRARDAIELYAPSKVTGALHAPAIFIHRGVQFDGSCKMAPLDEDLDEMNATQSLDQADERPRSPVDQADGRSRSPVDQADGRSRSPIDQADGRPRSPVDQADGRPRSPIDQADGRPR